MIRRYGWRLLHGLGELLITVGVVALLLVVYELEITPLYAARSQSGLHQALSRQWARANLPDQVAPDPALPTVPIGSGVAILRIPRFGAAYDPVIVQGVGESSLSQGPGHYPGTAMPGQIGNFVVSGHRTTWGHWFYNLNELTKGDHVVVETRRHWYVYTVTTDPFAVSPYDLAVVLPVPDHPGAKPTQRLLTLTTCNPRFSAAQRLIVHGVLTSVTARSAGVPPVLYGGV